MKDVYKKLKSIFEMPFDPSDEKTNQVNIINALLNIAILIVVAYIILVFVIRGEWSSPITIGIVMALSWVGFRFSIKQGYEKTVAVVLNGLSWFVVVYIFAFHENGLRAPAYSAALALLIVNAGVLLGARAALVTLGISLLVNTLIVIGETQGYYLTAPTIPDIRWALIGQMIFFSALVFTVNKTVGNLRKSIVLYRNESEERKKAEALLQRNYQQLRDNFIATVNSLATTIEMKDLYTAGHQRRVTLLACAIAEELGLSEEQFDGLRMAGLIHDLGKINVPSEILCKPGQISEIETSMIRDHPKVCHDLLKHIDLPWPVAPIVLQHHERLDGSGYPQGLKGDEIMLEARILAVADVVEAMASHRPYRPAHSIGSALEEILHNKNTLYDPEVVDACLRLFYDKDFKFE
jgi:hypothetical protein